MPTYEYECTKCKKQFEIAQRMSDPPKKRCPTCGGKVVRLISGGGGIILKGSGFYTTDYRSPEYKKHAEAERSHGESTKFDPSKKKKPSKKS
jgi:putative FmdB family regulatory protein